MNKPTIFGLTNEFDGDSCISSYINNNFHERVVEDNENIEEEIFYIQTTFDMESTSVNTWPNKWVPKNFKLPLNNNLQEKLNNVQPQPDKENLETSHNKMASSRSSCTSCYVLI
ncbi:hypothetical protein NQ314_014836 [Rhamnusium bicolor]|uniref:Uncharacterized protein n=1 Tax=Rhamnusium bicolor TaxID=1586634 RepID=A0AAV8X2M6_9CUCU|nr:hypothetical protein NQ314_014836 [Rhamnusium bicolor]